MKQSEENFLNMVRSVLDILNKNKSMWISESAIAMEVNSIERIYCETIGRPNNNSPVRYVTLNNNLNLIIRATIKLCRRMYLYARHHNDEIMMKLVDHSESTLANGSDRTVIQRCNTIVCRAEWMLYYLEPYHISASQLTRLHNQIDEYEKSIGDRSKFSNIAHSPTVSNQIAQLKERLSLLDELINGLIANRKLILEYDHSRIITDNSRVEKTVTESLFK